MNRCILINALSQRRPFVTQTHVARIRTACLARFRRRVQPPGYDEGRAPARPGGRQVVGAILLVEIVAPVGQEPPPCHILARAVLITFLGRYQSRERTLMSTISKRHLGVYQLEHKQARKRFACLKRVAIAITLVSWTA